MTTPLSDDARYAQLAAHADGTLDAESVDMLRTAAGGEESLTRRVQEQKQLKSACAQAMDGPAYRCPDELRSRLTAQFGASSASGSHDTSPEHHADPAPVVGRIGFGRWLAPLTAAAVLAVGAATALYMLDGPNGPGSLAATTALISQDKASQFEQRHLACGLNPALLMKADQFPQTVDNLDTTLANVVHTSLGTAALDLKDLGYTYQGAGVCPVPGSGAVHVVYRNAEGSPLSLWVQAAKNNDLHLEPGQVYGPPTGSPQAGRILIWRDGDVIMHLVGDRPETLEQARPHLQIAAI